VSPCGLLTLYIGRLAKLIFFMAPVYAANMAPPFVKYWPGWNRPISERWLGAHKTVIGFAAGVSTGVIITYVQSRIVWKGGLVDYDHWLDLGLRFGGGAMAGDSIKSFVKRRIGISPGKPWIPWDQLDFVLGALAFVAGRAFLYWSDVALIIVLSFGGHVAVNRVAYWMGVRDVRW
jgi:CDP-2,3-bis-(O-geranylgeranyl)-sn-glycerol synthase